jgi:hypothetical protein
MWGSSLHTRIGSAVPVPERAGLSVNTDVRDGRMRVHLYGTLTPAKRMLHPREMAYRLTQSPPWLMMPSRMPQRRRGRAYRRQRFTWSV